ncbi:MAG: DNA replication and repair protein RecF, partial [bacterium]
MYADTISLESFRNHLNTKVELHPQKNLLLGNNGGGKTNFMHGLYYLTLGRTPGKISDTEIVAFGQDFFCAKGAFVCGKDCHTVEIRFHKNQGKKILFDDCVLDKTSDLFGRHIAVYFGPWDNQLILGGPYYRRQFLNILLSQIDKNYFLNLQKYMLVLKQRNAFLGGKCRYDEKAMEILTAELIESGEKLVEKREKIVRLLQEHVNNSLKYFFRKDIEICLKYKSLWKTMAETADNILFNWYRAQNKDELKKGYTLSGPHLDDLDVFMNGAPFKRYG